MMAKRAIEEEFDRLYSDFIENPDALPRLKKRVKRCRQLTASPQHRTSGSLDSSITSDVTCSSSSTDKTALASPITPQGLSTSSTRQDNVLRSSERGIGHQLDIETKHIHIPPKKSSSSSAAPVSSSPRVKNTEDHEFACDRSEPSHQRHQASFDGVTDDVINSSHGKDIGDDTSAVILLGGDKGQAASDIFMLHKPRLNRVQSQPRSLNLDALWALYAKTWLLPKRPADNQTRLPVFLQRNLRQGCIYFKKYLKQQQALKELTKSKLSSRQQETQVAEEHLRSNSSKKEAVVKDAKARDASTDCRDKSKLKLAGREFSRAQKRKDVKPKPVICVAKKPNQTKTTSKVTLKGCGQEVVAKATAVKSGKLASKTKTVAKIDNGSNQGALAKAKPVKSQKLAAKTGAQRDSRKVKPTQIPKPSLKEEKPSSRKPLLGASSKQVWIKEASEGKQVAICRPNTKRKTPKADTGSPSDVKRKSIHEENPKRKLSSTRPSQEKTRAFPVPATSSTKDSAAEESEDNGVSSGIKPLFSEGHCGGIWKSIVDEC